MTGIQIINSLPISDIEKVDLTLVYAGAKPATTLALFSTELFEEEESLYKLPIADGMQALINLQLLGIPYSASKTTLHYHRESYSVDVLTIYTAKNTQWLDKLLQAKDHQKQGECYGYPQTGIDAYIQRKTYNGPLPPDVTEAQKFAYFYLSKKHWKKELELGFFWREVTKNFNPELYFKYTGSIIKDAA